MQGERGKQGLDFFVRTSRQDHAILSEVQIKIREQGTKVCGADERVAPAHKTAPDLGEPVIVFGVHGEGGRAWLRHQRSATAPQRALIRE